MKVQKIHSRLMEIMQSDRCTICSKEFPDRNVTYGGVTKDGSVEWVGECCVDQLAEVWCGGMVVSST